MNITSEKRFEILAHLVAGLAASGHYTYLPVGDEGFVQLKELEGPEDRLGQPYEVIADAETLYERLEYLVENGEPKEDESSVPTIRPKLSAVLIECPEGGFTAICPQIHGAVSEGETKDEACANLADAVQEILAANAPSSVPQPST